MRLTRRQLRFLIQEQISLVLESEYEEGNIVGIPGDPYEYKYSSGVWRYRKKDSSDRWNRISDKSAEAYLSSKFLDTDAPDGEESLVKKTRDFFFSSEEEDSQAGQIWLVNFPDAKPLTTRAASSLGRSAARSLSKAPKVLEAALETIFPQGHGGVVLRKSDGTTVYYDFGCYRKRCKDTAIEVNFIDKLLQSASAGSAYGAPGEVRRLNLPNNASKELMKRKISSFNAGGTTNMFWAGKASDKNIDAGIAEAESLYSKGCIQYSLSPAQSIGLSYNCGTFAVTIGSIAKTGGLISKIISRAMQYGLNAQPGHAIPSAATTLSALENPLAAAKTAVRAYQLFPGR